MILLQLLFCAALVFIVGGGVGLICVCIGAVILGSVEKAIDDVSEKITPTPDRYKKQQEVWVIQLFPGVRTINKCKNP